MPSWIAALKKYNSRQPAWCIPRKGTDEYNQVRKIMSEEKTKLSKKLKVVDSFKQKVGMADVPQDVMNLIGNNLGTKDKAQFNQVNKNLKIDYSTKEYVDKLTTAIVDRLGDGDGGEGFVKALDGVNSVFEAKVVEKKINAYYTKYEKEIKKYNKRIIKHIKSLKFSEDVEKHLIKYFTGDNEYGSFRDYETELTEEYEDYYKEYWDVGDIENDEITVKKVTLDVVSAHMKDLPKYAKVRYDEIIEMIDLYKTMIGNKIIKLFYSQNEWD